MKRSNSKYYLILLFPFLLTVFHIGLILEEQKASEQHLSLLESSFSGLLERYQYLPEVLSRDPRLKIAVKEEDYAAELNSVLRSTQESVGVGVIYLLNSEGTTIASSNYEESSSFMGKNYSFRPYFSNALSSGFGSYFGVGVTTGIPGYFLAARVDGYDNGVGVIVVKIEPQQMDLTWSQSENTTFVANKDSMILMSNKAQWLYNSLADLNQSQLTEIKNQKQFPNNEIKKIVSEKYFFSWLSVSLWKAMGKIYIINSVPLNVPNVFLSSNWKIYSASPFFDVVKSTAYVGFGIGFVLFSIYIFLQHQYVMQYAKLMEENSNRQRRAELQSIIDSTQVGLLTLDGKGDILTTNPVFREMVGGTPDELRGKSLSGFVKLPPYYGKDGPSLSGFIESDLVIGGNKLMPILCCLGNVALDEMAYVVTVVNISKRKRVERELRYVNSRLERLVTRRTEELKSLQDELLRQEKMIVLGRMAAAIVHELSQPVVSFSSALASIRVKQQRKDFAGVGRSVDNMIPLCDHMQDVIIQLRAFSYSGMSERKNVLINCLVSRILEGVATTSDVSIKLSLTDLDPMVSCNETMLEMAVSNVLKNAIEVCSGRLKPVISVTTKVLDNQVVVSIQDNSGSMTEDLAKHIFEPFFTTKSVGEGLGIGLAIAHNAIKDIGGEIDVNFDSSDTIFIITLPLADTNHYS